MDSGTVMEGTEGTSRGGMVPRRARTIPSYLAPKPFNPQHASVPAHREPRYPVRTVESDNTPPLEDPFSRRSGGGPAADRNIFGMLGIVIRHGQARGHLGEQVYFPMAPNMFAFLRVAGLRLKAVVGDPLRSDAFVLHLVAHLVANIGVRTFIRGSAVSAFCDGHVVDILSVTIGCDGCANGCPVHFSLVGLLWARHLGEDAKRPFCHCSACRLVFRAGNLNCLKVDVGV